MIRKSLSMVCAALITFSLLAGCQGPQQPVTTPTQTAAATPEVTQNKEPVKKDPYATAGKVTIAVPKGELAEISPVLEVLQEKYPKIDLIIEPFENESGPYLTAMATAGTMPDVLWGDWTNFPYSVASGYVRPLDDLLSADEEASYIPENLLQGYIYGGKTYAVPDQIHARMIAMNTDLLDELNIDTPRFDWNVDEFSEILKKATTNKTAGAAVLWDYDGVYSAQDDGFWSPAYNFSERKFYFQEKWLPAMNKLNELRAVPGLEILTLRNTNNNGETSDYIKKFGEAGKDDGHYTFKNGISLLCTAASWEANWMRDEVKVKWEYWPYPQVTKGVTKVPVHVNHTYMMSTAKDVDAAYQVLKWVSFGVEGNKAKMDIFAARQPEKTTEGKLYFLWYFPVTQHPDIVNKFAENPHVTEGLKIVYKNITNCFRDDLSKIIPGWNLIFDQEANDAFYGARDGKVDAAAAATLLDTKLNNAIKSQWDEFEKKLK